MAALPRLPLIRWEDWEGFDHFLAHGQGRNCPQCNEAMERVDAEITREQLDERRRRIFTERARRMGVRVKAQKEAEESTQRGKMDDDDRSNPTTTTTEMSWDQLISFLGVCEAISPRKTTHSASNAKLNQSLVVRA